MVRRIAFTLVRDLVGIVENGLVDEEIGSQGKKENVRLRVMTSNYCVYPIILKTVLMTFSMT